MKTNKIKVVLSLNKTVVSRYEDGGDKDINASTQPCMIKRSRVIGAKYCELAFVENWMHAHDMTLAAGCTLVQGCSVEGFGC